MSKKTMLILGHIHGGIAVVMDLASELFGITDFVILKNVDRPDCEVSPKYNAIYYFASEYDFQKELAFPIQFGAHHGNVKYALHNFFSKNLGIDQSDFENIIHPSAYFGPSSSHRGGILMEPNSLVSSMCQLGFGVTLKGSASVGHHAKLEDYVTINPGAVLSGFVTVGMGTEIGVGAVISNNVTIGSRTLIGAGSVVTRDIPDGVIAYGNPCKVIRENERWAKISY